MHLNQNQTTHSFLHKFLLLFAPFANQLVVLMTNQTEFLVHLLDESQANEINILDVKGYTSVTDVMIICSGRSSRHVKAIAENLIEHSKKQGQFPLGVHGLETGDWVLIDLGDCIVHVMQPETRAFYNLEGLWQN